MKTVRFDIASLETILFGWTTGMRPADTGSTEGNISRIRAVDARHMLPTSNVNPRGPWTANGGTVILLTGILNN